MSGTQENGRRDAQGTIRELRAIEGEIRAAEGQIEGYAAVFNQVAEIWPGWFSTMIRAIKLRQIRAGSLRESEATKPLRMSFTDSCLTLKPTLSISLTVSQVTRTWSPWTTASKVARFTANGGPSLKK